MQPPIIFVIILQYNHSQDTIKCLDSVKRLTYPNYQVVVVDNASQSSEKDNMRGYAKSQGNIILLENEKNLGYAGGNNVGIRYALANGADYVFILNNDTTVEPNLLDKLVAEAEKDSQVGIVGPAIKESGGQTAYYGKISWLKAELKHIYKIGSHVPTLSPKPGELVPSVPPQAGPPPLLGSRAGTLEPQIQLSNKEYVIGAGMLIKKEVLQKIGGFDEVYFLYFEDADLSLRVQKAGYKLKIAPETTIYHQVSTSTSTLGKPLILRYHMRNALIFNSLNAPWLAKLLSPFWSAYILLKNYLKIFLFPSKAEVGKAIINGVLDFYKNRYGKIEH